MGDDTRRAPGWILALSVLAVLFVAGPLDARDRNPWAMPEQGRSPPPGFQQQWDWDDYRSHRDDFSAHRESARPPADGRFPPRGYDPTRNDRRRDQDWRDRRSGDGPRSFPGPLRHDPSSDPAASPWGTADPSGGLHGSLGLYGLPDSTHSSPWSPYGGQSGGFPGADPLYPGTGLGFPGLGSPWYGAPPGGHPLYGLPY